MAVNDLNNLSNDIIENSTKLNYRFSTVSGRKMDLDNVSKIKKFNFMDETIEKTLKEKYHELLEKIVDKSFDILRENKVEFGENRNIFRNFFLWFLLIQFIVIITLTVLKGCYVLDLSDLIITTMIGSFFVETLGVVTIMVRYVFNSKTELGIINAIQKVAEHYKK